VQKTTSGEMPDGVPGAVSAVASATPGTESLPSPFDILADHLADWECWESPEGRVHFVTPACQRISGFGIDNFRAHHLFIEGLIHPDDLPAWRRHREMLTAGLPKAEVEIRIRTAEGGEKWLAVTSRNLTDGHGEPLGIRSSLRDITDRKMVLSQLRHQAWHDPLTGLPNRALCLDRLDRALGRLARGNGELCAVVFLDLDRFKLVNDTLGNAAGDRVLRETARRLGTATRSTDTVSRLGSDEFIILIEDLRGEDEARATLGRLREAQRAPFDIDGRHLRVTASMGVVLARGGNADEVLRNANIAMHHAKEHGGDAASFFHASMLEEALDLMQLEIDLHRALENDEFFLVYQPIVSVVDRRITGFEALLRWRHPERGVVGPDAFIALAEHSGLIHLLGRKALDEACRTLAKWRRVDQLFDGLTMHVNLSARQLSQTHIVEQVAEALRDSCLPPHLLKLEVTETMLMENPDYANAVLCRLRDIGVGVCVDDFGTGYSSLSYLQRFPIDTLKVDRSFVSRMTREPGQFKIVQAVIALAHSLGLEVVAEGVEDEEQRIMLLGLACRYAQGFLFAKPLAAEDVPAHVTG